MFTSLRDAGRALAVGAAFWLAMGDAAAVERKFETPIGMIVIDVEPEWRSLRPVPGGLNGIAFEVGSGGQAMQLVLATVEEAGQNVDAMTVRKLAQELRDTEEADGLDVTELKTFTASQRVGYYYEGMSTPGAKLGPGEYQEMIAGFIYTNTFPLMFTIAWNGEGKAAANRAFDSVKRLKIVGR